MLHNIEDIAKYLGAKEATNESISHRVYKDTECGAWAEVKNNTFRTGSIVEGADAETTIHTVKLPAEEEEIDQAIQGVEAEADDIWAEHHEDEHAES